MANALVTPLYGCQKVTESELIKLGILGIGTEVAMARGHIALIVLNLTPGSQNYVRYVRIERS